MSNSVTIKETHTFESKLFPGATFTLRRRNVRRKIELETALVAHQAKVLDIHIQEETADKERSTVSKTKLKVSPRAAEVIEITGAGTPKTDAVDESNTATAKIAPVEDTSETPFYRRLVKTWSDYAAQQSIQNKVELLSLAEVRPIYLRIYVARVDNMGVVDENDVEHDIRNAEDLISYAPDDFITEILDTMRTTREIGFALTELEVKNLQLPSTSLDRVVGQSGSTSAQGAGNVGITGSETAGDTTQS